MHMEITHIGHSCFKIKGKDITVLIDPYNPQKTGYKFPRQECDILLCTHNHDDHHHTEGVSGYKLLIDKPGEYEASDVFVYGIPVYHDAKQGSERGENIIYLIAIDGFSILHLGDLGHELSKESLEKIAKIDILMIPVGGIYTIDAEVAAKVISSIEPGIVLPMHYQTSDLTGLSNKLDGVDKFLDEMGSETKNGDKLKLSSPGDIPEETEVIVLKQQH